MKKNKTALFGSALLAAVVATVVVPAGGARATLVDSLVACVGIGGACLPNSKALFDDFPPYSVSDNDPLFAITADPTQIILTFTEVVGPNDLDTVGFKLSGLQSTLDLVVGEIPFTDITFIDFDTPPSTLPFVTNVGGIQSIQWTALTGADPKGGAIAVINLTFVPEPSTALLVGLGLVGLGGVGRSRREESQRTA